MRPVSIESTLLLFLLIENLLDKINRQNFRWADYTHSQISYSFRMEVVTRER